MTGHLAGTFVALLIWAAPRAQDVVTLTGVVQDTSCHPIPGARVSGSYPVPETITDGNGRFELRVPLLLDASGSKVDSVQLDATIAGFRLTARGWVNLRSGLRRFQTLTLDLAPLAHVDPVLSAGQRLPPTASRPEPGLQGEILTSQCQPIGGADVRLRSADGEEIRATSDDHGRFVFDAAPAGTYELEVRARGFIHVHRLGTTIPAGGTGPVRVLMDDGANAVVDYILDK